MELPNHGQFRSLLQEDRLFSDYINTFLNLPLFSKRFVYNKEWRRFETDPPINSVYHVLEDSNVIAWIHCQRLPLFWHSELFLEYSLCRALVEMYKEMRGALCSVSAVHEFRKFLFGSEGELACLFWLDVERLRHLDHAQVWALSKLVSKIHHIYLAENSSFTLSSKLKDLILFVHDLEEGGTCPPISVRVKALFRAQEIVLNKLETYWCKRYLAHLKESPPVDHSDLPRTTSAVCRSDIVRKTRSCPTQLPRIITDEGNSNAEKPAKKLSHVLFDDCKLPHIPINSCSLIAKVSTGVSGDGQLLEGRCARNSPKLAVTASTQKLFPQSIHYSTGSQLLSPKSATQTQPVSIHPYLYASLRCDFLAGNPFLRYLSLLSNTRAINQLLFWQSVETILTLDETKRFHQSKVSSIRGTLCPYLTYFELYPTAHNLNQLLHLFIGDRAPNPLDLPTPVRKELALLLSKGLGQNLLISVQDYVAECLMRPWMEFLAQDHQDFVRSCTTQRLLDRLSSPYSRQHSEAAMAGLVPDNIVQLTYGSSQLRGMWNALRLAENAKYPGIQLLPSRRVADVSLQRAEGDEEDDFSGEEYGDPLGSSMDVSLNPMLTTVYTITSKTPRKYTQRILSVTQPAHSNEMHHRKKPRSPKTFMEVLKDPEQLEFFRHFLRQQQGGGAEAQLVFWTAVEDLKSSMNSKRSCRSKTRNIQRRFFRSGTAERILQCQDSALSKVTAQGKASPFQLLAAQVAVADTMEKTWYQHYITYLNAEEGEEEDEEAEEQQKKPVCREHTKGLWNMFAINVVSFRRGLMNSTTADLFRMFLRDEIIKSSLSPGGGGTKKVVGTKVVNVTKLLNDLSFWVEVERYKNLADIVNAAKTKGTHTPEDDIMVFKKAHAIVNCYVDSAVSPRVQINIPNELVQYILDNISQGLISRGLFHEAALNIFSILILYWKRFCMVRYAPASKESVARQSHIAASRQHSSLSLARHRRGSQFHKSHLYPSPSLFEGIDCGPILSFSLSNGLRWIKPTLGYLHGHVDSV